MANAVNGAGTFVAQPPFAHSHFVSADRSGRLGANQHRLRQQRVNDMFAKLFFAFKRPIVTVL